jgi:hypothetical protein
MDDLGRFEQSLIERFDGCYVSPGGEVWVQRADALAALQLAEDMDRKLLGMEGFIVGESGIYPAMSRTDFSKASATDAYSAARALLAGDWAEPPDDVHSDAKGDYMIDLVVDD